MKLLFTFEIIFFSACIVHSLFACLETPSRRRSTRSVRRYGHTEDEGDEDIDDPDYQALSDSDDDPDFAPTTNKVRHANCLQYLVIIMHKIFLPFAGALT